MARPRGKPEKLDNTTRRSLNVLADATAEVVGRGDVYKAIVKVAEDGEGNDYETARDKFDHMDLGDRVRIRSQALEHLDGHDAKPAAPPPEEPEQLDWAKQMMTSFPKLSEGLDGDK
ncbi:hypothetical protein T8K17_12270 [Thalassobaculum sp. OXR-137]|uniref:hypothetical protein n=1 Tax=Thalassobaculum sp. OXR-137 TaxID=3100173 RepID=UPI002AC95AB4|nr:hypothetical protein [Thalassobaculum sp. OXR-137]WPZ36907.1 hypothetical protein T8K17_12270 [Thalassobaculum sp. OXR-137]